MPIKKLFINYLSVTAKAIIDRNEETKKAISIGDKYFSDSQKYVAVLKKEFIEKNKKINELMAFVEQNREKSKLEPVRLNRGLHSGIERGGYLGGREIWNFDYKWQNLWLYQDAIYGIDGLYTDDEQKLLILEYSDKERKKFEQLQRKFSDKDTEEIKYERIRIPEEVRIAVWRRDQGRCAKCGNRENLEYDHIVPVSRGGSTTVRNIELLCQNCNRSKGNRIE
jgi:hypothetical protein